MDLNILKKTLEEGMVVAMVQQRSPTERGVMDIIIDG